MALLYVLLGVFLVPVVVNLAMYGIYRRYVDIQEDRRIHEEFQKEEGVVR